MTFPNHIHVSKNDTYSCTLKSCDGKVAFSSDIKNYDNIVKELSGTSFSKHEYILLQKNEDTTIQIEQFKPDFSFLTTLTDEQRSNLAFSEQELPQVLKLNSYHYLNGDYARRGSVVVLDEVLWAPRFESFNVISKETNTKYRDNFYFYEMVNSSSKKLTFSEEIYSPV